ncbi:MAG: hypothetical protein GF308_13165 [Candidatus Heimdallarchaeota archaeon]|nr:hypothetical protein [Candidatus Heimdallarchaeota archaeon]
MGYFKGLVTTIGITFPSYLFIHIYVLNVDPAYSAVTVAEFFSRLFGGEWVLLMDICETAVMEPINVFFSSPEILRIVFAFLPWIVAAFVVNFFFRKRAQARGAISTVSTIYFGVALVKMFVIDNESLTMDMFTEANFFYSVLIINVLTLLVGLLASIISPFRGPKKEPVLEEEDTSTGPYYMPNQSPSRDQHLGNHQPATVPQVKPEVCEYCGSYIDKESQYCSVCGHRIS